MSIAIDVRHPVAGDPVCLRRCDGSRRTAAALRAQWVDGAVRHRDVEAEHGSSAAATIGPSAHGDRGALGQVVSGEAIGPYRGERADLDLLHNGAAVRPGRFDREVDVRIGPRHVDERARDEHLAVQIVRGLAVMR